MSVKRLILYPLAILIGLAGLIARPAQAQGQQTLLSLDAGANTTVQTGQTIDVAIRLDGAPPIWVVNAEISFDPKVVYVMGTKVGQPVSYGTFFTPPGQSAIVRNSVSQPGLLTYTISMLSPADPVGGSGVVGKFRIFPLAAGKTRLMFSKAEITTVTFTGSGDSRTASKPQQVKFTPVLLDLTITGDTVTPPPEVTPTPFPAASSGQGGGPVNVPQLEGTLINATAGPRTPEAATPPQGPPIALLWGGGLLILIAVIGFAWLIIRRLRRK